MAEEEQAPQPSAPTETVDNYIRDALAKARLKPGDPGYDRTHEGLRELFRAMLAPETKREKVNRELVDELIADIDAQLSAQINQVIHHPKFQKLESTWRGVKMLVDSFDFDKNIELNLINCTKGDLLQDFRDAPERTSSGLYKQIHQKHFNQYGGKPYGLVIGDYEFDNSGQDIELLENCAAIGAMAHAPFLTNASPQFLGLEDFTELENAEGLDATFNGPAYASWRSFRDKEDSRYMGLCGPRFLLRAPYEGKSGRDELFNFKEDVEGNHESYLWGGSAFALATRVADSFAKYKWAINFTGPKAGGAVKNLPVHVYQAHGGDVMKIPTEVLLPDDKWHKLTELGFIPLVHKKGEDHAAFFRAPSSQRPKTFPDTPAGRQAEANYRLGTEMPYLFMVARLAHYIKVLQREELETWKSRESVEAGLNEWLSQYVADMESPAPEVVSRKPLKKARVKVTDVETNPGFYDCSIEIMPHFKFKGANFTLSLVSKLGKEA